MTTGDIAESEPMAGMGRLGILGLSRCRMLYTVARIGDRDP